ncbi:hypothetical protein PLESTM_001164600 [Pleodorina starrii]|nr:hypothetical protein PLESTM_001164600 [Pleodorina starrii]
MLSWFRGKAAVKSPELKEAESVFTDAELKELQKLFHEELAHQAGPAAGRAAPTRDGALDLHLFGALLGPAWFCLDPLIACQLQRQLADRADGKVHLSGLVIAKVRQLHGS